MSEMIERVTRAICRADGRYCGQRSGCRGGCPAPWGNHLAMGRDKQAMAAVKALREPTEEMLNAARDWSIKKNGQGIGNDQAIGCFQAMIDVALSGSQSDGK